MKNLLRLEELAQFLLCLVVLIASDVSWWVYLLLLIGPDIGMLGYLINTRVGAFSYNILHHKGVALLLFGLLTMLANISNAPDTIGEAMLVSLILYGHASLDRIFGYGLKFRDSFQHTHLGWIGKGKGMEQEQ